MNKEEVFEYLKEEYGVEPDYPFAKEYAGTAVFRHRDTSKWFLLYMEVAGDKLGHDDSEPVEILTMKSESMLIDGIILRPGFHRAYHMNKRQWLSVELSDRVNDEELKSLIGLSFDLTDKKKRK